MSEFIAITLQGQFIVLHGVRNSLHGVNEFSVWSKKASVLLCIARSKRKQFNLKNRKEIQKSIGAKDLVKAKADYKIDTQRLI